MLDSRVQLFTGRLALDEVEYAGGLRQGPCGGRTALSTGTVPSPGTIIFTNTVGWWAINLRLEVKDCATLFRHLCTSPNRLVIFLHAVELEVGGRRKQRSVGGEVVLARHAMKDVVVENGGDGKLEFIP